jgi:hypothetical protein
MKAYDNLRVAFEIGQDCALYGQPAAEPENAAYMRGYSRKSDGRRLHADRFVKKWLQVRTNAWRRNRHVDSDFSVQLLREIDRPICPVSNIAFTYGTGLDTDWSVDRIDNNGGYTAGNVMLVTARVNREKGSSSLLGILMLGYAADDAQLAAHLPPLPSSGQLSEVEWQRLAWFASTQEDHIDYPARAMFADSEDFPQLTLPWCSCIQRVLVEWTSRSATLREEQWAWLRAYSIGSSGALLLRSLRDSMTDFARLTSPPERSAYTCFADPVRWRHFANWWVHLARTGKLEALLIPLSKSLPNTISIAESRALKRAEFDGYG